jgi:DNA-binding beta-propeller fold protein YncE
MRFLVASMQAALLALFLFTPAANGAALHLTQNIPLPGVEGRIDHLAVDLSGQRLFVCALGNDSLEVIDLQKGQRLQSITGLGAPQGVAYAFAQNRLYVANDKGGLCNIYDGKSLALVGKLDLADDADNVRYDNAANRVFVGYGNGALGVIEAATGKLVRSIKLPGHPEALVLEKNGPRAFVNVPTARQVAVVDRNAGRVVATWQIDKASANFPIALDEGNKRLFVGCRHPAEIIVLASDSGNQVTSIKIADDTDDIFYDEKHHRLYAVCGAGRVEVIEQVNADNYRSVESVRTADGARTGLFAPELNSLFVAIPHRENQRATIHCYRTE